jgi:transposase
MRTVRKYDEAFKGVAVQKALSPGAPDLSKVAKSLGVPTTTLYDWTQKYAKVGVMKKPIPKAPNSKKEFTPEEKLQAIINKSTMTENEFGEFLRSSGLHSADVENFKNEYFFLSKEKSRKKQDPEVAELRKEKKNLQSDLNRKDKALAEMSARIVLLKKSHLLWGDPEGEE